jgi:arylsulfatase A-like enzyme/sugar lactone lactonase YvrE
MNRSLAKLCCLLAVVVVSAGIKRASADDRPNVVLILADDVGCEPLGCYGGKSHQTPNIDALAASGMRFTHCYSMPVCHPTRVCLITGRYPMQIGNPRWGSFPQSLETKTIAQVMKSAGYATAVAGKWQLAMLGKDLQQPHRMGFDEYCLFGWHEGPRYHDPLIWQNGSRRNDTAGKYGPDLYVDFLLDFIKRNQQQPFFALYSMALCHDVTDDLEAPVPYAPGKDRYDNYGEMISQMDRCVGRVVDGLEELGLRKNTIILFTGDNGTSKASIVRAEPSNGKKKWKYIRQPVNSLVGDQLIPGGKGNLTNDGTNVPLIVNGGKIQTKVVDDLIDFSDFLPTVADIGGASLPAETEIDGISFAARLLNMPGNARRWAFAEHKGKYWVRSRDWKLYNDGRLFNMRLDAGEQNSLSAATSDDQEVLMLRTALRELPPAKVEPVVGGLLAQEGGRWDPTSSPLASPFGVDFDGDGNMFVVELEGGRIHQRTADGELKQISGDGSKSYRGDGGPVGKATYNGMHNCAVTPNGDLYIADSWNHCIRKVDHATGNITTIAGTGAAGFSGDGGPATAAKFNFVMCITLNHSGDKLYVADLKNKRIRCVDLRSGIVETIAGNGKNGVPTDGAIAASSPLVDPRAVASDSQGRVYILERGGNALRVVDNDGTIRTVAGTGRRGNQDGPAMQASFGSPKHICVDDQDNVYIADDQNRAIRKYDPRAKTVSTVLGEGHGDQRIKLLRPHGVTWEADALYVVDTGHNRILKLTRPANFR